MTDRRLAEYQARLHNAKSWEECLAILRGLVKEVCEEERWRQWNNGSPNISKKSSQKLVA